MSDAAGDCYETAVLLVTSLAIVVVAVVFWRGDGVTVFLVTPVIKADSDAL